MAIDKSKQFLQSNVFRVSLNRLPKTEFFTQQASIPGLTLGYSIQPTPYRLIPKPSDKIEYDPLNLTFKVNEDLSNFEEIVDWMKLFTFGQSDDDSVLFSDATLHILSNKGNKNRQIKFINMFPIALTELFFDSTTPDPMIQQATATFMYQQYEFVTI